MLAYFTRPAAPPTPDGLKLFKAVIISSAFIVLTHPKPRIVRWTGGKLALLRPYQLIPADVGVEVGDEGGGHDDTGARGEANDKPELPQYEVTPQVRVEAT